MPKIYLNGVELPKPGPVPDIEGCVTDGSGNPISGVTVGATMGTDTYSMSTDGSGCYAFRPSAVWNTVSGDFDVSVNDPSNSYVPASQSVSATNTGAVTADFQQI